MITQRRFERNDASRTMILPDWSLQHRSKKPLLALRAPIAVWLEALRLPGDARIRPVHPWRIGRAQMRRGLSCDARVASYLLAGQLPCLPLEFQQAQRLGKRGGVDIDLRFRDSTK